MADRAVPAGWATADATYGSDDHFRIALENHGLGHVVGVRTDFAVVSGWRQVPAKALLAEGPADGWHRPSRGDGAKGLRAYDRALLRPNGPAPDSCARWPLIRRSVSAPAEVAYFAYGGPSATMLPELARVAGTRRAMKECFEPAKGGGAGWTSTRWGLDRVAPARHLQPVRPQDGGPQDAGWVSSWYRAFERFRSWCRVWMTAAVEVVTALVRAASIQHPGE